VMWSINLSPTTIREKSPEEQMRMTNVPKDWNKKRCEVYVFLQSEAVSLLRNVKN